MTELQEVAWRMLPAYMKSLDSRGRFESFRTALEFVRTQMDDTHAVMDGVAEALHVMAVDSHMTDDEFRALSRLRARGFAVAVFAPHEMRGVDNSDLQDYMVAKGHDYLDEQGEQDED